MNGVGRRLILAVLLGAVVYLGCVFFGGLLAGTDTFPLSFAGKFLESTAAVWAAIAAAWYFFSGGGFSIP